MEPKKKRHTGRIVFVLIILLGMGGILGSYRYLTGEMERDSFVPAEALSTVDTGNIVRETMPETTEIGLLDEQGNATDLKLPEEALAVLRGESTGTGIDVSDTEPAENTGTAAPETETTAETEPETETTPEETEPAETQPAETKPKETKPPETKPKETKPPETKPKETKPPETKPAGEAITLGSNVSYLLPGASKIKTFVLYGLDRKTASDVVILTALDPVHNKCKIISIARDTYSYISEKNAHAKLTYAYSMGGAPLAVKTLNENFYLHMEDYVAVDFSQAESVVDLLGGASVEVDETELAYLGSPEGMEPGLNLLNGKQAVTYARLREMDNDLVRTGRQREVIRSLFQNFKSMKLTDYPAFFRKAAGMCTTSFTDAEILSLGTTFLSMKGCTFEQYNYPNSNTECWGGLIDDLFYWVYDLAKVSDEIYRIIYEDLYVSGYTAK